MARKTAKSSSKKGAAARSVSRAVASSSVPPELPADDGRNFSPLVREAEEFKEIDEFEELKELIDESQIAPVPPLSAQSPGSFPAGMLSILLSGAASLSGIAGWILGKMRG